MPRGVAIPELRQHLFAAAERVIAAEGAARLSGRAVTRAAGVATGLLYAHFNDLDGFLAAYAVDRAFVISAHAAALPAKAGAGDVAGNVGEMFLSIPLEALHALARLMVSRPELADAVHAVLGDDTAALAAVEAATVAYLAAEQRLGRLPGTADPGALALALTGALHHLALTAEPGTATQTRLAEAIAALIPVSAHARAQDAPGATP